MNHLLSRFGIGGARVDTLLPDRPFKAGEQVYADVIVTGGRHVQTIDGLHFVLYCSYEKTEAVERHGDGDDDYFEGDLVDVEYDDDDEIRTYVCHAALAHFQVEHSFVIQAKGVKHVHLNMLLPLTTPQTKGRTRVWLSTELDIKRAVDAKDKDYMHIQASVGVNGLCRGLQQLGFRWYESRCEATKIDFGTQLPFVQEFSFRPEFGFFLHQLKEIEVIFLEQTDGIEILIEKDRDVHGLRGWMSCMDDLAEVDVRCKFTTAELQSEILPSQLYQLLSASL